MKNQYQIESQRAVKRLEEMAANGNPAVQMVLPLAEMVGWLRKGVGELIRQARLQLMELLMEEEVREVVGERSRRQPDRTGQVETVQYQKLTPMLLNELQRQHAEIVAQKDEMGAQNNRIRELDQQNQDLQR